MFSSRAHYNVGLKASERIVSLKARRHVSFPSGVSLTQDSSSPNLSRIDCWQRRKLAAVVETHISELTAVFHPFFFVFSDDLSSCLLCKVQSVYFLAPRHARIIVEIAEAPGWGGLMPWWLRVCPVPWQPLIPREITQKSAINSQTVPIIKLMYPWHITSHTVKDDRQRQVGYCSSEVYVLCFSWNTFHFQNDCIFFLILFYPVFEIQDVQYFSLECKVLEVKREENHK